MVSSPGLLHGFVIAFSGKNRNDFLPVMLLVRSHRRPSLPFNDGLRSRIKQVFSDGGSLLFVRREDAREEGCQGEAGVLVECDCTEVPL